jgi:hypothetical protein
MREILRCSKRDAIVLESLGHQRPTIVKIKRRAEWRDMLGRSVRTREVVREKTRLKKTVLEDFLVFVEFFKVLACCRFVSVPA